MGTSKERGRAVLSCILICGLLSAADSCARQTDPFISGGALFEQAAENGRLAAEAFSRSHRYLKAWLERADPETGLIPRNLESSKDIWNAPDAAADNYAFMVLTARLTDAAIFEGPMHAMLETETRLTSRLGNLPDTYSFSKKDFAEAEPDIDRLIFGGSEYIKDGLLPLTEWLGPSPWSERLLGILDDIWNNAPVETPYGPIPSTSQEVNGEMMQTLARVYWMTGEKCYLEYALRLADYYLFHRHPTRDETQLRLRDHGCEILSGLTEVYAAASFAALDKKKAYEAPIHLMLDRVLEVGRDEHGLLFNAIDPQTGEHDDRLCDTWGYNYNGFYTVYLVDGTEGYREAIIFALSNLYDHYRGYDWERGSADGDADTTESAINLYNREPIEAAALWIDEQIRVMWGKQREDGIVEGWHGDGNFARTSLMYALWKTKGVTVEPWREDIRLGAEQHDGGIYLSLSAGRPWQGKVVFDRPRHHTNLNLPLDYPRINQFPEWFTVDDEKIYAISIGSSDNRRIYSGLELCKGLMLQIAGGQELRIFISEVTK